MIRAIIKSLIFLIAADSARAENIRVAVASNFTAALELIAPVFQKSTGHEVMIVPGSTGKLYSQIHAGAPFDVFLGGDAVTAAKLEGEGIAVGGTHFTYAVGHLALWSRDPSYITDGESVLRKGQFRHISVANPTVAPYGAAAMDVLNKLGLTSAVADKLVLGENVAQAHQFVATGNAELGFIAVSEVFRKGHLTDGSVWVVPEKLQSGIRQDAVLLLGGEKKPAAKEFLEFLRGEPSKSLMESLGYSQP